MIIKSYIEDISKKTGLSIFEINSTIDQWATPLMQKGIIVNLKIKYWRGVKKISPEELGFNESSPKWNEFNEYFSLGTRNLLTKEASNKIRNIENKARKILSDFSFETIWGRFVPFTMFSEWDKKNKEVKEEYLNLANELKESFHEIKSKVIDDYKSYFHKLWNTNNIVGWKSYSDYEDYFLSKIKNEIISPMAFKESFSYDTFFYFIPMPSDIERDVMEAKKIQGNQEIIDQEIEMKKQLSKNMIELRERHLESFLEDTVGKIRSTILSIIKDVRDSLNDDISNRLTIGKNRKKLLNMIETVRKLNFYNDENIQNALDRLGNDLNKNKDVRSEKNVSELLREIEGLSTIDFKDLIYGRFNLIEI